MEFDALDQGISLGGIRNKSDIKTLICYMFCSVGVPMSKHTIIEAIQKKGLANYFEASQCFDDLVKRGNVELVDEKNDLYFVTEYGKIISHQLEDDLSVTVKEKAYACALEIIEQNRIENENEVTIKKAENGYHVTCDISGGDVSLMNVTLYVPDSDMASHIKKRFHKNTEAIYKAVIATMTGNKDMIEEALEQISDLDDSDSTL